MEAEARGHFGGRGEGSGVTEGGDSEVLEVFIWDWELGAGGDENLPGCQPQRQSRTAKAGSLGPWSLAA